MGTGPNGQRYRDAVPWAGAGAWAVGAAGLWLLADRYSWSPGERVLAGCGWLLVLLVAARDALRHLFGPVFAYEILRLGRRRLTFVLRGLYVCGISGWLAFAYLSWLEDQRYSAGGYQSGTVATAAMAGFAETFFYTFLLLQVVAVAVLTPAYVAPAICDEKERKTLEFLLATDLRNREIVFGKLAARVGTILYFVLAGLPVIAFLQLFGGIDPDVLLAATAATVATVFGLAAVGIWVSVHARKARDAIALTYLLAAVYLVGSFFVAWGVRILEFFGYFKYTAADGTTYTLSAVTDWVAAGNVAWLLTWQYGPFGGPGGVGWIGSALARYVAFWGAASVLLTVVAVARVRAVALKQAYGGAKPARERRAKARPAVGDDPIFWREVFVEGTGRTGAIGWLVSLAVLALVFVVPAMIFVAHFGDLIPVVNGWLGWNNSGKEFPHRWESFAEAMSAWVRVATGVLTSLALMAVAVRGAGAITGERDRDTWISLASTPVGPWEVLVGKWWGAVLSARRVYAVMLLIWCVGLAVGSIRPPMVPAMLLATAVYVAAYAWLGLFCSVTARTTLGATVRAILGGVFFGGGFWFVVLFCCVIPISLANARGVNSELEDFFMLLLGCTPPFVSGWLPLWSFEAYETEPFRTSNRHLLGPLAPVLGLGVWAGFAVGLAGLTWRRFRALMNRDPQPLRLAPARRAVRAARPVDDPSHGPAGTV